MEDRGPLIAPFQGRSPAIPASAFVAPTALVVGDVVLGEETSVWYGSVLRGDVGAILLDGCEVGEESLIGAGSVLREGTVVPPRSFAAGVPAIVKGPIPPALHARLRASAAGYVALAREHAALHDAS